MEYRLKIGEDIIPVQCHTRENGRFTASIDGKEMDVFARRISSHQMQITSAGKSITVFTNGNAQEKEVFINGRTYIIADADVLEQRSSRATSNTNVPTDIVPPMPAIVIRILVAEGDQVERSQPLIIVAAMKMETTLNAPYAGVVSKIHVSEGDKVAARQVLMDIEKVASA